MEDLGARGQTGSEEEGQAEPGGGHCTLKMISMKTLFNLPSNQISIDLT